MSSTNNSNIEEQLDFIEQSGLISDVEQLGEQGQRFHIHPDIGHGSLDLHHFKDMTLGRASCRFNRSMSIKHSDALHLYGFHIMLKGRVEYSFFHEDKKYEVEFKSPEIWIRKGNPKNLISQSCIEQTQEDLFVNFQEEFIQRLLEASQNEGQTGSDNLLHKLLQADEPFWLNLPLNSPHIIELALQLHRLPSSGSTLDLIALKGAALSLASQVLTLPYEQIEPKPVSVHEPSVKAKALLDRAVDTNLSIHALARTVGSNECDLKREFKKLTGKTINQYIRQKRMEAALKLLQQGESDLSGLSSKLGYSSKDYFVKVFRDYYAQHPKECISFNKLNNY